MTVLENNYEAVLDYLKGLDDGELISFHGDYCDLAGYTDDKIYYNDEEFFEIYFSGKIIDAVRAISYGSYDYTDTFVRFNGLGNLDSENYLSELIDLNELADYIYSNSEEFSDYIEFEETDEEE